MTRATWSSRWVVADFLRELARRFWQGSASLRLGWLHRWLHALVTGLVPACVLVAGMVRAARALEDRSALAWEPGFLDRVAAVPALSYHTGLVLGIPGNGVMLWPLTVAAAIVAVWSYRPHIGLSLVAGLLLTDALVMFGWLLWDRPRPEATFRALIGFGRFFHAFPSGHSAQFVSIYGFLAYLWIRGSPSRLERAVVAVAVAGLLFVVSLARMRVGAHWPSDIIAGIVLGLTWLTVLIVALRRAEIR